MAGARQNRSLSCFCDGWGGRLSLYRAGVSQQSGFPLLHVERSSAPQTAARHSLQDIAPYAPAMLSILRIVVALLFLEHGLSRLFGFPSPLPAPALFSLYWFCLLYTSDAADDLLCVDLGGR